VKPKVLIPPPVAAECRAVAHLGVGFGRRFFFLSLLGLLWAIPAFWDHRFLLVMAAWDFCAIVAWVADLLRLPRPSQVKVTRNWSGTPSLSNDTDIILVLENGGSLDLHCRLMDDVPATLRKSPPEIELTVPGKGSASSGYAVRPLQRGNNRLGPVYLRYQSGARFAERWVVANVEQSVRIFPDLEEARKQNLYLTRARQIELEMRLVRQRGTGREFESLREYREGDEFRNICWTATARRGKYVSKIHQVERSQAVWLVLDAGRLLRAKVGELSKLDMSVNAALSLAQIALHSGDRVGLLVYGRKIQQRIAPNRGLPHLRTILESLADAREEAAEADHLLAASVLLQMQKQRSMVLWITDLADTSMTPEVIESASQVLSKHLLLFTVMAQTDLTAMAEVIPNDGKELFEMVAAQEIVQRREILLTRVATKGALALEVAPGKLATTLVNQYLQAKERNLI